MTPIHGSERLIVVVGPSGAGKDSVLRAWRERLAAALAPVHFAQRVVTRPRDGSEAHEPVDEGEFARLRDAGELTTWWQANGLQYGLRREQFAPLAQGRWVVMNGSRMHLPVLRTQAPQLRAIEITADDSVRAERLVQRAREDEAAVRRRLRRHAMADAALVIHNNGPLVAAVDALHRWWLTHGFLRQAEDGRKDRPSPNG